MPALLWQLPWLVGAATWAAEGAGGVGIAPFYAVSTCLKMLHTPGHLRIKQGIVSPECPTKAFVRFPPTSARNFC